MPDAEIERIVLGTAALGLPYGLPATPGGERALLPEPRALEVLDAAWSAGVRTLDTAPAYGAAEDRVGRWAHASDATIWTKAPPKPDSPRVVAESLARSLTRLGRSEIHLFQWHNWTRDLGSAAPFRDAWVALARDERVRALGATTYGAEDARAAVQSGLFEVVQIEWNLLNQHVLDALGDVPRERGVRIAVRTVLLQGVLAGRPLPDYIADLAAPRSRLEALARERGLSLPALVMRAALDHPEIDYVLVGADSPGHVAPVLEAIRAPRLDAAATAICREVDRAGSPLVDPLYWLEKEAERRAR